MGASNFTLEGWIRMDNTAKTYRTMASNLTDIGGGILQGYDFFVHQNKKLVLWMSYKTGGSYNLFLQVLTQNISNLDDNTWHHVAAVRTGSSVNDITLYVDGTPYTMANGGLTLNADNLGPYPNFDTDLANTARTWLGAISVGSNYTSPADHFLGDIKQFRIYKRALSGTEISANFVNTCNYEPMDQSMLVFYAPLNEGTTAVAPKDVLNNLSGTHSGTGNSMSRNGLTTSTCTSTACDHCISTEYLELAGAYRFGFNGKERDDEMYDEGNSYDFGARILDVRSGRWMSVDPLQAEYASLSAYNFTGNNPILLKDPDGKKIIIYYSDANGKPQQYEYNSKQPVPNNDFVQKSITALNHIVLNDKTNVVANVANSSKNNLHLSETTDPNGYTSRQISGKKNPQTGELIEINVNVEWNPNVGHYNSDGGAQSPATILFHEIAAHSQTFFNCSTEQQLNQVLGKDINLENNMLLNQYTTTEDADAVLKLEPEYINSANNREKFTNDPTMTPQVETPRISHKDGGMYYTRGVTSITPQNKDNKGNAIDITGKSVNLKGVSKPTMPQDNLQSPARKP